MMDALNYENKKTAPRRCFNRYRASGLVQRKNQPERSDRVD
jgi:hypothetical protein